MPPLAYLVHEEKRALPLERRFDLVQTRPRGEVLVGGEDEDRQGARDPLVEVVDVVKAVTVWRSLSGQTQRWVWPRAGVLYGEAFHDTGAWLQCVAEGCRRLQGVAEGCRKSRRLCGIAVLVGARRLGSLCGSLALVHVQKHTCARKHSMQLPLDDRALVLSAVPVNRTTGAAREVG